MRVEFVIDELVLIGFDPRDRHRIADALQRELASRARAADAEHIAARAESMQAEATLRGPDVTLLSHAARPAAIARGVSRSIVSALRGESR